MLNEVVADTNAQLVKAGSSRGKKHRVPEAGITSHRMKEVVELALL